MASEHEVYLYDIIGRDFWGDGITADDFRKDLPTDKSTDVRVRINSPGGDVHQALGMKSLLAERTGKVTIHVDGLAASAATFVLPRDAELTMAEDSIMMIHDPMGNPGMLNAEEMIEAAGILNKHGETIAGIYAKKTGKSESELREIMKAETWYTADEALEAGIADRIVGEAVTAIAIPKVLAERYHHVPDRLPVAKPRRQKIDYAARGKATLAMLGITS